MTKDEMDRHITGYIERAVIKYAGPDLQPIWESDEEWRDNAQLGLNWELILSLCKLPLVRTCVQYAMAYEMSGMGVRVRQDLIEEFGAQRFKEAQEQMDPLYYP
jgi:hypothetical protein